jgi:ubiquinone/menaquinone biosynthesis C-methylase UbiE
MTDDKPWSGQNVIDFYSRHRNSEKDLYDSERYMLSKVSDRISSVLDVGCAAGGFYTIFQGLNPGVSYTGIDISEEMIHKASFLHPGVPFFQSKAEMIHFPDDHFDLVYCSGTIHMSLHWREMMRECWRVARKFFIFDVRLVEDLPSIESEVKSYEKIAFNDSWDGHTVVPYVIINVNAFLKEVDDLNPRPCSSNFYGYYHNVSPMTVTEAEYQTVCMTMVCLSKEHINNEKDIWALPFPRKSIR